MEPSKEKTTPGGHRPPGDTALNCPTQSEHPLREHGRSAYQTPEPPAPCRTPHSSGKPLNLTSSSSRAFRFAKRFPGTRGDHPPFGTLFTPIFTRPSPPPPQALRCAPLPRVVDETPRTPRRARRPGVPLPRLSSFVSRPNVPRPPPRGFQRRGPQASPLVVSRGSRGEIRNPPGNLSWEARGDILLI